MTVRDPSLPVALPRSPERPLAEDWAALRAEGMAHIRKLAGQIWTDHNAHDPGITALEVLCYALTDLAYRAGHPVADLLTRPDGRIGPPEETGLVPAHEALPTAPRTLDDYRRLLMRVAGVRNAWLDPVLAPGEGGALAPAGLPDWPDEPWTVTLGAADLAQWGLAGPKALVWQVPVFADCAGDGLSYAARDADGRANRLVHVGGLYRVAVDLEDHPDLGPLNEPSLTFQVRRGPLKGQWLTLECRDPALDPAAVPAAPALTGVVAISTTAVPGGVAAEITLQFEAGPPRPLTGWRLAVADVPGARAPEPLTAQRARALLNDATPGSPLALYWAKLQARSAALARVRRVLHANRGLCEDFDHVAPVAAQNVSVCADLDLAPDADIETVQAEVYLAIERYLSPPVVFRSLADMLADGHAPDAIFDGPYADPGLVHDGAPVFDKHGFVTDETVAATELRRAVHASDLINLFVDIPGVVGVRNLLLRAYDAGGTALGESRRWRLDIAPGHRPVHFERGSKLVFYKDGLPYRAGAIEAWRTLDSLRDEAARSLRVPPDQVLRAPRGRFRDPGAVVSVQEDFPDTYAIGRVGLPGDAPPDRVARARQFKAYLTVFDQLLAGYLGQLANLHRLFGLDPALTQTRFPPHLTDLPAVRGPDFATEFYTDPAAMADDAQRLRLEEDDAGFAARRTAMLDHLIARFAERFTDLALTRIAGEDRLSAAERGIAARIGFLRGWPAQSRRRGMGANLRPADLSEVWDSGNVSGLEARLAALLGLAPARRADVACAGLVGRFVRPRRAGTTVRLGLAGPQGAVFRSRETWPDAEAARTAGATLADALTRRDIFTVAAPGGTGSWRLSLSAGGVTATDERDFDGQDDAWAAARAILAAWQGWLAEPECQREAMHLIEHVLLRPRAPGDPLVPICEGHACSACGDADPYSFRVSIILPAWPARFRRPDFRRLVERTARTEAPAHVHVKLCWIGQAQMGDLDAAHRAWLAALAGDDPAALRTAAARLIEVMAGLKTEYPPARLHDCDDGDGDETTIRLGETGLGLF